MAFDDLGKVAPLWMNLSLAIFLDKEANKEWGWVQVGLQQRLQCGPFGLYLMKSWAAMRCSATRHARWQHKLPATLGHDCR